MSICILAKPRELCHLYHSPDRVHSIANFYKDKQKDFTKHRSRTQTMYKSSLYLFICNIFLFCRYKSNQIVIFVCFNRHSVYVDFWILFQSSCRWNSDVKLIRYFSTFVKRDPKSCLALERRNYIWYLKTWE